MTAIISAVDLHPFLEPSPDKTDDGALIGRDRTGTIFAGYSFKGVASPRHAPYVGLWLGLDGCGWKRHSGHKLDTSGTHGRETALKAPSVKFVAARLPSAGRGVWRDPDFRGLECVGRGSKARWYLRYSVDGHRFRTGLADFPETTPTQARELARIKQSSINTKIAATDKGEVARELRKAQARRKIRASAPTLGNAIDAYSADKLDGTKRQEKTVKEIKRFFDAYLNTQPDKLMPEAIKRLEKGERKRAPSQTDTVIRRARPLFRWMYEQGWTGTDLLLGFKVGQSPERDVSPTPEQMAQILLAADMETNQTIRAFVYTLAFTAQRRGNVAAMQIGELDAENLTWTIPSEKAKTATDYVTPISETTAEILFSQIAEHDGNTGPDGYVFKGRPRPTGQPAGHFNGFGKLKARLDARLGPDFIGWQFHDFRRAFSDAVIDAGADPSIADRCLNHAASQTTSRIQRRYQRSQQVERQRAVFDMWVNILNDTLATARGEKPDQKVINIQGHGR